MLVIDAGIDPGYVLDKMEFYEIEPVLKRLQYKHKDSWEQTRMICYIIAQSNSTKKIKPSEMFSFPWDGRQEEYKDTSVDAKERERLIKKAEQYKKSK